MNFRSRIEYKKGKIGEDIIFKYLQDNGYVVYTPVTDKAHKIDFFCHSGDNKSLVCVEVKTKKRMANYERTGIEKRNYLEYVEIYNDNNIDTIFFFVDEFEGCIYSGKLSEIGEPVEDFNNIVYWQLDKFKFVSSISVQQISKLAQYSNNHNMYKNTKRFFK